MRLKNISFISLIFLTLLFVLNAGCGKTDSYRRIEGMVWNTIYHITYKGPENLSDSILPVFDRVSKSLSIFDKESLVSRLNDGDSVKADGNLLIVYEKSREINRLSGGMFDPTVSPLIDAWGFGVGHKASADTLAIDSLLQFVGIGKTMLRNGYIVKEQRATQFNFSAIAKGYGCDAIAEMFRRNGVEDFMIEVGGELTLSGKSPSGSDWRISVDAPTEGDNIQHSAALVMSITDAGIATSGNYRNYSEKDGVRLAHTISPATGRPFFSEILSATVVAPTCMEADALATACMASSLQQAKELLQSYKAEGLLILGDSLWMTPGFGRYISGEVSEPGKTGRN